MDGKAAFIVRSGFTLKLGRRFYHGGEIVDLTEAEARASRHMIELAPEQAEESGPPAKARRHARV